MSINPMMMRMTAISMMVKPRRAEAGGGGSGMSTGKSETGPGWAGDIYGGVVSHTQAGLD